MNRELHRLAARKQVLLAELQLQRMQITLYASDARDALRPAGLIGGAVARPAAAMALVDTRAVVAFLEVGYSPSSFQSASTRRLTAASMAIGRPHVRCVSAGHLPVASMPILLPSPATGEAKSR